MESYAAGETEPALLEETIAASFDRTEVDLFARGLIAGGSSSTSSR